MRKLKLLLTSVALLLGGGISVWAQTDVTSTYLTNADFSQTTASTAEKVYGYGKDGTPYGLQNVDGWTKVVTNGDNSNATYPNSGMAGVVVSYGSSTKLQGGGKAAPATNPSEVASGNCLGFFAVWGCGGYYYQKVTLPAGKYTLTFPIYNQQGTQANTTFTGFFPTSGTNRTVAINTTVGSWANQTVTFTLAAETTGQIRIGYQSTGNGSGANPHLFFDGVTIEYTALVVKDVLSTALTAATNANTVLSNSDLTTAIATAQAVYDDEDATQEQVNNAAATLNAATELAMSAAGDVTGIFLSNPGFESSTVTTTNAAAGGSAAPLDIAGGWTQVSSAAWSSSAVVAYGGSGQVNGASAPSADNAGNSGNALGVSVGWGGLVTYQSAAVTLPAGVYTLQVNAYNNLSGVTQFASKFGFVPTDGAATLSSKNSFAYATWETDKVTFTLNEATEGKIQVGGQAISGGSGSNAKVFFDNITITYKGFLAGAKEAWADAVTAAGTAKTENPNVTGEELTALNAELAKAEPNTLAGYNEATEALETATATLISAATSYNALVAVNAMITAAGTLEYADSEKKPSASVTATSASDADTKTASQFTALRAYYESHAKAEGVAEAIDYTSAVSDANSATNTGWTNGVGTNKGQSYTNSDGTTATNYLDGGWASNAVCNIDMTRSVEIPAGKYLLTVKARGAEALTTYTLSIGGETINLPHSNGGSNGVFGNGWEDASIEFDADGTALTLEVIAKSETNQQWFSMNDFRLVRLDATLATSDDYIALNAAITVAEAKTLGFEDGEYAPYNNVEALTKLAEAKAINQSANNEQSVVQGLTTYLNTAGNWKANTADVDAIFNGSFSSDVEGDWGLTGWTRTNGWGQQQTGLSGSYTTAYYNQPGSLQYGNKGVYKMPLAANTIYKLTFAYRSHENNSNNGMTVSVLNDEDGLAATTFAGNGSTSNWKLVSQRFKTGAAGNYVLTLGNDGNTWMTNVSLVKENEAADITISEDATAMPQADPLANVTLTRTLSASYWNTFSVPFDAAIPTGWTVKEFDNATDNVITFKDATTIVAGKPYLVKPTADAVNSTFDNVIVKSIEGTTNGTGDYKFSAQIYNKSLATNGTIAYLATDGKIKKLTSANGLKGLRAYFIIPAGATEARIAFIDDETNGIKTIDNSQLTIDNCYDLQGRKVAQPTKGLYIKNGKKVIMK